MGRKTGRRKRNEKKIGNKNKQKGRFLKKKGNENGKKWEKVKGQWIMKEW